MEPLQCANCGSELDFDMSKTAQHVECVECHSEMFIYFDGDEWLVEDETEVEGSIASDLVEDIFYEDLGYAH